MRRPAGTCQQRISPGELCDPFGAHERSADGPRVFDSHLCRFPRRRGRTRHRRGAGCNHRRPRRTDGQRRRRPLGCGSSSCHRRSRCAQRRSQGGRRRRRAAGGHHASPGPADDFFHAAQPVERRHRQFWRRCPDERLCRHILNRQSRADGLSRRQRGRRAGRRISCRSHQAPWSGRCRLLCGECRNRADDRADQPAAPSADGRHDPGRISGRRDRHVARHDGSQCSPPGAAGRAFGIVSTGFNVGGIISPLLFGWIMDQNQPHWVFGASAVFMVGTVLLVLATERTGHGNKSSLR